MGKKRKYSKSWNYTLTNKMIKDIGGLVAEDEIFKPCPYQSCVWVSNYARILTTRHKRAQLMKPRFENGYRKIHLRQTKYGKVISKSCLVHRLVAELFVTPGSWINPEDTLQVHHIKPINRKTIDLKQDFASNLMWVPTQLHHSIDRIYKIEVCTIEGWKAMDFVAASEQLGIDPYKFFEICGSKQKIPLKIDADGWEFYAVDEEQLDNISVDNLFRVKRKGNKKSDN